MHQHHAMKEGVGHTETICEKKIKHRKISLFCEKNNNKRIKGKILKYWLEKNSFCYDSASCSITFFFACIWHSLWLICVFSYPQIQVSQNLPRNFCLLWDPAFQSQPLSPTASAASTRTSPAFQSCWRWDLCALPGAAFGWYPGCSESLQLYYLPAPTYSLQSRPVALTSPLVWHPDVTKALRVSTFPF